MSARSKKLPINLNPPIKAYLSYAHILSMILPHEENEDWFYSSFIQLYSQQDTTNSWVALQFTPDTHDLLHDQYLYQVFSLNPQIIDLGKDIIIDSLIKWISNDYYIMYYLDEYYLPGTVYFQKEHIAHAQFFYGYNQENKTFSILNFSQDNNYESIDISYDDLINSLLTDEIIKKYNWIDLIYHNPKLIRKSDHVRKDFDLSIIIEQLSDYTTSKKAYSSYLHNSHINECKNIAWGIDVYDNLIKYINKTNFNSEYMPFHLLWEHKVIMLERFNFLIKKYNVNIPDSLITNQKQIIALTNQLRFLSLSLEYSKKNNIETFDKMINLLSEIKTKEFQNLTAVIKCLTVQE